MDIRDFYGGLLELSNKQCLIKHTDYFQSDTLKVWNGHKTMIYELKELKEFYSTGKITLRDYHNKKFKTRGVILPQLNMIDIWYKPQGWSTKYTHEQITRFLDKGLWEEIKYIWI